MPVPHVRRGSLIRMSQSSADAPEFPFARIPVVLTDGDLELSIPTEADVPAIAAACQDPAIAEFTPIPYPYTEDHARAFATEIAPANWRKGGAEWAIRVGGRFAGMIGLMVNGDTKPRQAEIGYWMAPEARGTGALTRAIPLVLEHGFGAMGLERIQWGALAGNWPSWRAVWRYGFRREGMRRATLPDGRDPSAPMRDLWIASLLRDEPRTPAAPWDGPETTAAGTPAPAIPSPRDPEALVRQFHATYGLPIVTGPADVDIDRVHMRMALITEEYAELMGAVYGQAAERAVLAAAADAVADDDGTRDTVGAADALADLIYVIYGMALETGIPLDAVLHRVQRSNMSKLGADGLPIYREDGKVLKGPGFFEPHIAEALAETRLAP